ncbi:Cellobiose dehydrogenase-like protein [Hapsidospora chrysogenum ATCC 11550]|uniref:Cellobiose dehydrogenase-like protein n=1 Tax=Hapsidospora chrysogenum (strain ATCC 11550 / CBS 779.69 / DSM 880 / IAM 14645 / JCM 23072 / IMI 49137) TaxID=857340 RepID=A0A086T046_HAPC1|nr:Cellobiose dehydrogenase-like protein [Hapsidospora chrysogenum ATCC 11550]
MRCPRASALLLALAPFTQLVSAQSSTPTTYEDPDTGIIFDTWQSNNGDITFGFALPSDALDVDATEYIGLLRCNSKDGEGSGWCGLSLGGLMTNSLLVTAYPHEGEILTALMWATGYEMPVPYAGDAEITQVSSKISEDSYELIYRCVGCLAWDHEGATGGAATSSGGMMLGWAFSAASPGQPACPADITLTQHGSQFIFRGTFTENIANEAYDDWTALATGVVPGDCGEDPTPTSTPIPTGTGIPVPTGTTYDYIVVGGGAAGIPLADRLSEAGNSVLLIEKGPVSTGQWGGEWKPEWLEGTDLTRFDVPGLCNQIWVDSAGIACRDTDQMAGCLLGGGTAINAGLWWRPKAEDWDYNFPSGWKSKDMAGPAERVFERIPGTLNPSQDGTLYRDEAWNVLSSALSNAGWTEVNGIEQPDEKRETFTHGPFMFADGERGGPLATYLASASKRDNFNLWTNTQVKRVIRYGGKMTGVEVENYAGDGYVGTVNVTPGTGRVILSAGTFGSAKILMRSGIGPEDQLEIVANSAIDGETMIGRNEWINLPVGYNLEDHTNTDTVIAHPDVVFYDFYEAYDDPIQEDRDAYLNDRAGILAQAAPNIGPVFFDEIEGADGITRSLQWTARVEASLGINDTTAITMSQYLGRGAKSRGRMTITSSLNTVVSDVPYLKDENDVEAVITGLERLQEALSGYEGLVWLAPSANQTAREFVEDMLVSTSNRRANHWIGTNKIGNDNGLEGGTAVVDLDTRVWGTDNLFVVDASIFPGMITPNPSAYIVTVAERASERILALRNK